MLVALGSVIGAYAGIACFLASRRLLKMLDLHDEHQFVRSREQRNHIKQHAIVLKNDFKSDALWPKSLYAKSKSLIEWLKST